VRESRTPARRSSETGHARAEIAENGGMTVIAWNSHETVKCPAGSTAWHPRYGHVRVLKARGWSRLIEVRAEGVILSSSGQAVSFPERRSLTVDVRELERAAGSR
jgi:hypothetical protein